MVRDLSRRFVDPDEPDNDAASKFLGLCEDTAFALGEEVNVNVFVLERDGARVGDPTDSFTNSIGLIVNGTVVTEAIHC